MPSPLRPLGLTDPLSPPPPLGRDRPLTVLRSLLSFEPSLHEERPAPSVPPSLDDLQVPPSPPLPAPPPAAPPTATTTVVRNSVAREPRSQPNWQAAGYQRPHRLL